MRLSSSAPISHRDGLRHTPRKPVARALMTIGMAVLLLLQTLTQSSAAPADPHKPAGESAMDLRLRLNSLYGEFALLSWSAVLTAGSKKQDSFKDAAGALDENAGQLARTFAQVYGDAPTSAFLPLWKKQTQAMLDYAQAAAHKNQAAMDGAARAMDALPAQMGALFSGMTHGARSSESVTTAAREALTSFKAVADAQAVHDFNVEYRELDKVYATVGQMAHDDTAAAVAQFPSRYVGNIEMPGAQFRVRLNTILAQQMFTLAMANRAMYNANIDEYYALFARSDLLTDQLSRELAAYGGADLSTAFSALWKKYIASLQDYEKAREGKDKTMQRRVLGDLGGETRDLVALFIPSTPSRVVGPPRKGAKKPKLPPPPPFTKDVKAYMDANLAVIDAETLGKNPFGPLRQAWVQTRLFTEAMSGVIVQRYGTKAQSDVPAESGK